MTRIPPSAVFAWIANAEHDAGPGAETFVANLDEKRTVVALERRGLVKVRRTDKKTAGLQDWWVSRAVGA